MYVCACIHIVYGYLNTFWIDDVGNSHISLRWYFSSFLIIIGNLDAKLRGYVYFLSRNDRFVIISMLGYFSSCFCNGIANNLNIYLYLNLYLSQQSKLPNKHEVFQDMWGHKQYIMKWVPLAFQLAGI